MGQHPGLAEVRLRLYVYNPMVKREIALPERRIDLLVGSLGDVDQAITVIRRALDDWIRGYIRVT